MLFSSPDYPLFLIAVFFLYGLARWGGHVWARIAVMILLADVVFLLVAKNPDALWDPVGGTLLRLAANDGRDWPAWLFGQFAIGGAVLAGAVALGRKRAAWIASDAGQRRIALGFVVVIAVIGTVVAIASALPTPDPDIVFAPDWPAWFVDMFGPRAPLDELTRHLVAHAHLAVLAIAGIGVGAAWIAPDKPLGRVVVLFVASSLFYQAWASAMPGAYRYLLFLLLGTIVLDYYLGIWIERTDERWKRKALVIVSLCSNLGILVFFKYTDFFIHDVMQLDEVPRLNLILPAGISFHTFQSLSYTIDVYRKELPATRSPVEFATFVLFFPQLVAGPIVRAQDLLPQLANPPPLRLQAAQVGMFRVVVGLFKKIALADTLALSIVDRVFENPTVYSSVEVACGVYGYALQIYLDFSAYSDIAIGSAQILGFSMPENFRTPYRSANIQEFWRRWHISLSTWLRDYLYITLGGSRHGEALTYVNLILTMLLGGLWHGASWAFIVWGALHGFGLAITRYFQRQTARDATIAWRMFAVCGVLAAAGIGLLRLSITDDTWTQLVIAWLFVTPLWAVLTAWLGRERPREPEPVAGVLGFRALLALRDQAVVAEWLRIAMVGTGVGLLAALHFAESWTWIPIVLFMWTLGIAADIVERGVGDWQARLGAIVQRALAVVLVFHYVCFAWVFFRAPTFEAALAVLRRIAEGSTDHANLVSIVTTALVVGFTCHFFADGSFRWLRRRFVATPAPVQGLLLACVALVLRELAHHEIVPFIYFQF